MAGFTSRQVDAGSFSTWVRPLRNGQSGSRSRHRGSRSSGSKRGCAWDSWASRARGAGEDPALIEDIEAQGATLERSARATGLDLVFFGPTAAADLERLAVLGARIQPAGAIWLVRAKGRGAPIGETQSMAAAKRAGLVDVKVVSYSDTQSAEKYVIPLAKRPKPPASARRPRTPR